MNKTLLFYLFAVAIVAVSLYVSDFFVDQLAAEERNKVEVWTEAQKTLSLSKPGKEDMSLVLKIIESNNTIPVILCDDDGEVLQYKNFRKRDLRDSLFFRNKIAELHQMDHYVTYSFSDGSMQYIYYDDSSILKMLQRYPYIQLGVMLFFSLIVLFSYEWNRRSEENKVWVGLSKETAHQLGTPISSLMAWRELLELKGVEPELVGEMGADIDRLKMIAERFSKIGANPGAETIEVSEVISRSLHYLGRRISPKVKLSFDPPATPCYATMSEPLFGWVIENLTKNAADAMDGIGSITYNLSLVDKMVCVDVTDTGKGLARSKFKKVFMPGYTTKARGWGLGLSLVKRIIERYYKGKVFVYASTQGKGTTFRILLRHVC